MQPQYTKQTALWREWPVYAVWLALIVYLAFPAWPNPLIAAPLGPDDALHLVQVRDLLGGQNWFDLVQYRLQSPEGLDMHWSRLIDAPIAGISYVFGEPAMLFLWPGLLTGAFLFAALYGARRLSPSIELLPVILVSALCLVPLSYFAPARIDHHNVQLVLALVMGGVIVQPLKTNAPAVIAAFCGALMMAIGLETLPYLVAGLAVVSLSWAFGFSDAKPVAFFGTTFAGLTAFVWMLQSNIQSQPAVCDMLSPTYVFPIIFGGLGLELSTRIGKNLGLSARLGLLAVTGIVAISVFILVNPACLGGPMAQVPLDLQERWLKTVAEAQPLSSILQSATSLAVERYCPPVFAVMLGIFLAWKRPEYRYGLSVILTLLLAACAVSAVQLRGTLFAHAYTIPIFALAIDLARKHYAANQKSVTAIGIIALAFLTCQSMFFLIAGSFVPLGQSPVTVSASAASSPVPAQQLPEIDRECAGHDVRDAVAKLGKKRVATPVFYGAQVLEMGTVSVIAGPYHRATAAIFDALKLFEDGPVAEQQVLLRQKPDYLALCLTSDDTADVVLKHPESLTARLKKGRVPQWLETLPKTGQLAIYRVLPNQ